MVNTTLTNKINHIVASKDVSKYYFYSFFTEEEMICNT
jgi:hypothetical protein